VTEWHFALLASTLATSFVVAGLLGRRGGDARRDVRLMLACGAACGALALFLFSLSPQA
jgi:hypothetical protein